MKYLLPLLSLTILFSQELEVEGDLKVTGTVESATIDSLNQVIANMQAQIDTLQNNTNISSKIFQLTFEGEHNVWIESQSLHTLTGLNSSWYKIEVLHYDLTTISGSASYAAELRAIPDADGEDNPYVYGQCSINTGNGGDWYIHSDCKSIFVNEDNPYIYYKHSGWSGNYASTTLTLLITSEF